MARDTMGPYETEAEAADAAYKATRATGEPHTIAALGADLLVAGQWLVARGRIRECWLEKKLAAPPTIAWPLFWISPVGAKTEEADKPTEPSLIAMASPQGTMPTPIQAGPAGWVLPSDEMPRPKGKKS